MKKEYLLVGSNNFWYATHTNKRDAKAEMKNILAGKGSYGNPENDYIPESPQEVFIYEASKNGRARKRH